MDLCKRYWIGGATAAGGGPLLSATHFDIYDPWFYIGLTLLLLGGTCLNTGYVARRSRTLDEEFAAGYRMGERAGRRTARPVVIPLDDRRPHGRVQETALWAVAGDRQDTRRAAAYQD